MKAIDLSQIPPDGLELALGETVLDLGEGDGLWRSPAAVTAELRFDRTGRGVLVSGRYEVAIELVCCRCSEAFPFRQGEEVQVYLEPPLAGPAEEMELGPDEMDVRFLEEDRIDVEALLRENVLLALPVQPRCHEDCRGLCPRCGANLNEEACACGGAPADPRLAVLRKLL